MLTFKPLQLNDITTLRDYYKLNKNRLCDNTPGVTLMWRDMYHTEYAIDGDCLYFKVDSPELGHLFTLPLCGCRQLHFKNILEYCKQTESPLSFFPVGQDELEGLQNYFPNSTAVAARDSFDYLYHAESLQYFRGKKLSGQRNHVNKFLKTYSNWAFSVLTAEDIPEVQRFLHTYAENRSKTADSYQEDLTKTFEVLDNMEVYGMVGGMLKVDGNIAGFSLGEVQGDTLFTHIEKADRDYQGSYQMLVAQFAQQFAVNDVVYINREDDAGDLGLRTSKLAYQPTALLEKYMVTIEEPYERLEEDII